MYLYSVYILYMVLYILYVCGYESARAAITKSHSPGGLHAEIDFFAALEAGSLRSRCQLGWFLWFVNGHLLPGSSHGLPSVYCLCPNLFFSQGQQA